MSQVILNEPNIDKINTLLENKDLINKILEDNEKDNDEVNEKTNNLLKEISDLDCKNFEMEKLINLNKSKKRKLEKILYESCKHDFKFSYRMPHDSAVYTCTKCGCYNDEYYYL